MPRLALLSLFSYCVLVHGSPSPFDSEVEDGVFLLQQRSTLRKSPPRRPTAVFIAGLEGSGHHFFEELFQQLLYKQGNGTLPFQVGNAWFANPYLDKVTGSKRETTWRCGSQWKKEDMDLGVDFFTNLTKHVWDLKGSGGLGHVDKDDYGDDPFFVTPMGCLSYPCGLATPEHKKSDLLPRADLLAEAAATAGVDMHVGVLYRPPEELLAANCIHRRDWTQDQTCEGAVVTQIASAKGLLSQLRAIDAMPLARRPLVQCLQYGELDTLIPAVGKLFNNEMSFEPIIKDIWKPGHTNSQNPADSVPNWGKLVVSLRQVDAELRAACARNGVEMVAEVGSAGTPI